HLKSVRDVSDIWVVSETRRRTQIPRLTVERPAAQYMHATLTAHPSRAVMGRATIIVVPAIFHPLGHIARGVVEAEAIGLERPDGGRPLRLASIALPADRLSGAQVASPPVSNIRSSAGGVFPFRFGGKPTGLADLPPYPTREHLPDHP